MKLFLRVMKQKSVEDSDNNKLGGGFDLDGKVVVVAVRAAKEISKAALVWALTHVVHPGDCIKLLVVIPSHTLSNPLSLSLSFSDKILVSFSS